MSQAKGQPLRWSVEVVGRTARGLLRGHMSYHTDESREDAESDAIEEAKTRFRPSTVVVKVSSYMSNNYSRTFRERLFDEAVAP